VETLQRLHQVPAHGAADAAVHNLDDLLVGSLLQHLVVYPHLPELVLDHRKAQAWAHVCVRVTHNDMHNDAQDPARAAAGLPLVLDHRKAQAWAHA